MDRKRLSAIAADARRDDALRLGLPLQQMAAVAAAVPKLPVAPAWFDVEKGEIAVSPDCSYQLVAAALRRAKKNLLVYIYNLSAPHLLDELTAAKQRGVTVRVMFDTKDSGADEVEALKARRIEHIAAPSTKPAAVFSVCHQKFVVIDDRDLLIESANWAGSSVPYRPKNAKYKPGNREWFAWMSNDSLAQWFSTLFEHDWKLAKSGGHVVGLIPQMARLADAEFAFAAVPPTQFDRKVLADKARVFPLISPNNYASDLLPHLKAAKSSICIQQQYILAGKGVDDLLEVLEQKKKKVKIRILVSPKYGKNWYRSVETLKAAGLGTTLRAQNLEFVVHGHNKGVLIDDSLSVVSSTNWSENSVTRGREAGLLIESKEVSRYFQGVFDFDWSVSLKPTDVEPSLGLIADADEF